MTDYENENFCKKMRKATKEIHAVSDALVNAKLVFGMNFVILFLFLSILCIRKCNKFREKGVNLYLKK